MPTLRSFRRPCPLKKHGEMFLEREEALVLSSLQISVLLIHA